MTEVSQFDKIRSLIGFILTPIILISIALIPTPETFIKFTQEAYPKLTELEILQLAYGMKVTLGLFLIMVILWLTEALPIPATALLPAVILPIFHVVGYTNNQFIYLNGKNILSNYANPIIYLFMSSFLIARAMQKWGLDKRVTYSILSLGNLANNPRQIILILITISAFLSLWISNTATTAMLLPIVVGIIKIASNESNNKNFAVALSLSIAYGASIGGLGTIIGTPPNGICVSILKTLGIGEINFLEWMKNAIPIVILMIPILWLILLVVFPFQIYYIKEGKNLIIKLKNELGNFSLGEKLTLLTFLILVFLWISNPFWKYIFPSSFEKISWIDENIIALAIAILMFFIPVDWKNRKFLLDWNDSKFIDWGTLILFGGGIALSDAMFKTGLAAWLASSIISSSGSVSSLSLILIIVLFMAFMTEVTSNTAVTSMMIPILISISYGLKVDGKLLSVAATFAASMAYMLPVATPPNAIVYGSGFVQLKDMIKVGIILDFVSWLVITFVLYVFGFKLFHTFTF